MNIWSISKHINSINEKKIILKENKKIIVSIVCENIHSRSNIILAHVLKNEMRLAVANMASNLHFANCQEIYGDFS